MTERIIKTTRKETHDFAQRCSFCTRLTYTCFVINDLPFHICKHCREILKELMLDN